MKAPPKVAFAALLLAAIRVAQADLTISVFPTSGADQNSGSFGLVHSGRFIPVQVRLTETPGVVRHAVEMFNADLQRMAPAAAAPAPGGFYVGVVGDPETEKLATELKLDLSSIAGKWEHYSIFAAPKGLVVIGSDARGAAFGLMDLLERVGVSPWTFWADVPVPKRDQLFISGKLVDGPKVKFRGIFINDEDWGLQPWAAKTFEPEYESIGPKTYSKVFELLLRLRANTLWPAMHKCSKSFNSNRENPKLAGEYGIVMGSSHCEPLLTNNEKEWTTEKNGEWRWETNRGQILAFLEERVQENGKNDNLYTIGMRGIHDRALPNPKGASLDYQVKRLQDIFEEERKILAPLAGGDAAKVPQVFIPYKEVLDVYNHGLNVPDDVTLVWVDDNHGWIRRLPNEAERKRSGGGGVYYHHSYWGAPQSYLWLDTTPPAQTWLEMKKAYDYGVDRVWITNVGDIKSTEKGMDYFLRLAWNPNDPVLADQSAYLKDFATKNFGAQHAQYVADMLDEYYTLTWGKRPEHLGRNVPNDPLLDPKFADGYMRRCNALYNSADSYALSWPAEGGDAYFQLVQYPVVSMTGTAVKVLAARESRRVVETSEPSAAQHADYAEGAWNRVVAYTKRYNEQIAEGKWRGIVDHTCVPEYQRSGSSLNPPMVSRTAADKGRETRPAPTKAVLHLDPKSATLTPAGSATLKLLNGLGTDGAVAYVEPRTLPETTEPTGSPSASWRFDAPLNGEIRLTINALPTHHPSGKGAIKCAFRLNDGPLQWVEFPFAHHDKEWDNRVLTARMSAETKVTLKPGPQVLTVYPMGSDLVLDSVDLFQP